MEKSNKDSQMPERNRPEPAYVLAAVVIWALVAYSVIGPVQAQTARVAQVCER